MNSHSLSDFQRCEEIYRYNSIVQIEPIATYYPFTRGALISKILQLWYMAKQKKRSAVQLEKIEERLMKKVIRSKSLKADDGLELSTRLFQYFCKYRNESWEILAIESGFSKILYEDDHVLFIYEGKPDLIVDFGSRMGRGPVDHKSESRMSDIYEFNNQFMGYCWATDTRLGIINYIGLQIDSKKGEVLRRTIFQFTDSQIKQWREDTIHWYYRAMWAIANKKFLRSWRCEGKYGNCVYTDLCENPMLHIRETKIKTNFKKREEYRSW